MECSEQKSKKKKLLQDPGPKRKDTWDVQAFVALKIVITEQLITKEEGDLGGSHGSKY